MLIPAFLEKGTECVGEMGCESGPVSRTLAGSDLVLLQSVFILFLWLVTFPGEMNHTRVGTFELLNSC